MRWSRGIDAPSPLGIATTYDILIAIPIAYDLGTGLDGFYIALPYSFNNGEHNRVNGQVVTRKDLNGGRFRGTTRTASSSRTGVDTIESHIFHCRGFFLARGAVNARV